MLGYGRTAKIYSFSDPSGFRMTHLSQLMEVAGVGDAFYVGNSAGGGTLLRSAVRNPSPLRMKKMVTICGNAGVFKSESQADLEDYTPSIENMRKLLKLLFSRREVADPGKRGSALCRLHRTGSLGGLVRGPPEAAGTRAGFHHRDLRAATRHRKRAAAHRVLRSRPAESIGLGRAAPAHRAGLQSVPVPGLGPRARRSKSGTRSSR